MFCNFKYYFVSLLLIIAFICSSVETSYAQQQHAEKPNIIFILADDLGWNDVGFHGGVPKTPNIDRLAEQSLELSRFYVAPICTPTRAGIMTGRYPIRFGMMRAVIPPWRKYGLPPKEETLPEMLGRGGYANRAALGKWHLGHSDPKYHPLNQGFTYFYGAYNGALDYFIHKREGELDWHQDFEPNYDEGYVTDLLTNEAVSYIKRHKDDSSPFFLYLPYTAPHAPQQAPEEYLKMYPELEGETKVHAAMVTAMDDGVGKIMKTLKKTNLQKETLLFFVSDNGGAQRYGASNAPLRGQKQEVFEGGVRAVAMVRWPGHISTGKTPFETPMSMVDIFPTLQSIAGVSQSGGKPLDGIDLSSVFHGDQTKLEREVYNYWGQQKNRERLAIWKDGWKLIYNGPDIQNANSDNQSSLYLFNLKKDSEEEENLVERYPEKVPPMLHKLKEFRKLQPQNGLPPYGAGRAGFSAPENWNIYLFDHDINPSLEE
jgi:arylsulfatase B